MKIICFQMGPGTIGRHFVVGHHSMVRSFRSTVWCHMLSCPATVNSNGGQTVQRQRRQLEKRRPGWKWQRQSWRWTPRQRQRRPPPRPGEERPLPRAWTRGRRPCRRVLPPGKDSMMGSGSHRRPRYPALPSRIKINVSSSPFVPASLRKRTSNFWTMMLNLVELTL